MDSQYTFDTFVVGGSNKLAFMAAKAVVEKPTEYYNPLFIYGRSGVGKTHLLYAIKNAVCDLLGADSVMFLTGEDLSIRLVNALKEENYNDFQRELSSCKYLLLDDLHTLVGKTATQKEYAYIFRTAVNRGQQVVFTASVPPSELPILEDSLRNDFSRCLIADIAPLDYDTSREIVLCKLSQQGMQLSEAEIDRIAEDSNGQARYIEGRIKKLEAEMNLR